VQPRVWLAAVRQGIRNAPLGGCLSESAWGLWRLSDERLAAYALSLLDFYHAVQHLWKRAAAWVGGRSTQARRWFGWARHRLRYGKPAGGLVDLADALALDGTAPSSLPLRSNHAGVRKRSCNMAF
jgi:hypothetical protein